MNERQHVRHHVLVDGLPVLRGADDILRIGATLPLGFIYVFASQAWTRHVGAERGWRVRCFPSANWVHLFPPFGEQGDSIVIVLIVTAWGAASIAAARSVEIEAQSSSHRVRQNMTPVS